MPFSRYVSFTNRRFGKSDKEGDRMEKMTDWKLEGIDVAEGCMHCGGEKMYGEILNVLFSDMPHDREKFQNYYETADWKSYIVAVHSVKSSMASVGVFALSEMARKLEMAGKRADTEYIMENHNAMVQEYDRIYQVLKECPYVKGQDKDTPDNVNYNQMGGKGTDGAQYPGLDENQMMDYVNQFEEAFYELDEEKMLEILSQMEPYIRNGKHMKELLVPIRRKVEMMDYMSAFSMLGEL